VFRLLGAVLLLALAFFLVRSASPASGGVDAAQALTPPHAARALLTIARPRWWGLSK
jgi:hypothetical protein